MKDTKNLTVRDRKALAKLLVSRLDTAVPSTDVPRRICWVANHVVEFFDRWRGFALMSVESLKPSLQGNLFGSLEAAADVLAEEVRRAPTMRELAEALEAVRKDARALRERPSMERVEVLDKSMDRLTHAIPEPERRGQ